jgi:DNA invertase Pin-like site-specific DNA recombinase
MVKSMEAVGYIRVSNTNPNSHENEIATQKHKVTQYLGEFPSKWFIDAGISGATSPMTRPGFVEMASYLEENPCRVVAGSRERFGRGQRSTEEVRELLSEFGCQMEDPATGVHDLSPQDPSQWLMDGILTLFSEYERRVIVNRLGAGKARAKSEGKFIGGKAAFGYRIVDGKPVEIPEEQAVIQQILNLPLSIRETCDMLGVSKHIVETTRRAAKNK